MRQPAPLVRFSKPSDFPGVELVSVVYPRRDFPPHSHPEFVIGAVVDGAETLQVGKNIHHAPAGTALLLHPDETHANASVGPRALSYRVMYVSPATMEAWMPEALNFDAPISRDCALIEAILIAHATLGGRADNLTREAAFGGLMNELAKAAAVPTRRPQMEFHRAAKRAREFIDECFASKFNLGDLARAAELSRFHLVRTFKCATGLTPVAYRNQRRIEAARHLLHGKMPIAQIALEVGFADQSHLTRQFQRLMGISPALYRQQ